MTINQQTVHIFRDLVSWEGLAVRGKRSYFLAQNWDGEPRLITGNELHLIGNFDVAIQFDVYWDDAIADVCDVISTALDELAGKVTHELDARRDDEQPRWFIELEAL